jgi:hypothetical protein
MLKGADRTAVDHHAAILFGAEPPTVTTRPATRIL